MPEFSYFSPKPKTQKDGFCSRLVMPSLGLSFFKTIIPLVSGRNRTRGWWDIKYSNGCLLSESINMSGRRHYGLTDGTSHSIWVPFSNFILFPLLSSLFSSTTAYWNSIRLLTFHVLNLYFFLFCPFRSLWDPLTYFWTFWLVFHLVIEIIRKHCRKNKINLSSFGF